MHYIFIENGQLNGCGECKLLNTDIICYEVSEEVYNKYLESPLFYKWDGEKIVENPNFEAMEKAKYNEEVRMNRQDAYASRSDSLISRKLRKQVLGEWSDEEEEKFIEEMKIISYNIQEEFPYK